jgi:hypothetical protein
VPFRFDHPPRQSTAPIGPFRTTALPSNPSESNRREKSLYWIEGTERRFDGYNFFGVHPEIPIEWFDKHLD